MIKRNQRDKGIKAKHVLQICLLLAICLWLMYQVKHSRDKKEEFDENDDNYLKRTKSSSELVKLGRKDLQPRIEGSATNNEKHREEPEEETVDEEEGNKLEEEDQDKNDKIEDENDERVDEVDDRDQEKSDVGGDPRVEGLATNNEKHREEPEEETVEEEEEEGNKLEEEDQEKDEKTEDKNDEHKEGGGDEVDDHDQEKSDVEGDREEDSVDEDKEQGEDDEKETEGRDSDENDGQVEDEKSLEVHDHEEDSTSSHEAREEQYKADDASSAVTHDTEVTTTENENGSLKETTEHADSNDLESEISVDNSTQVSDGQNSTELKMEDGVADGSPPNTTNSEERGAELISSYSPDTLVLNSTRTEGFTDNPKLIDHLNEVSTKTQDHNVTVEDTTSGGFNLSIVSLQQLNSSADMVENTQTDSNLTISRESGSADSNLVDTSNVSGTTDSSLTEKVAQGNESVEAINDMELPSKENNANEDENSYNIDERGTTDEELDTLNAENLAEHDSIDTSDSSDHLEEKDVRTDLETLPEIQTEGSNSEDAAVE